MNSAAPFYLDWAGASLPVPSLADAMAEGLLRCSCNPEAVHPGGRRAKDVLAESAARLSIAAAGRKMPAVWAGSGSELFRIAALAASLHSPRKKALLSAFEHPAAYGAWKDFKGGTLVLPPEKLAEQADKDTGFVLVSHVQSVLGAVFPLEKIFSEIRQKSPHAVIFADTIQSACRFELPAGADFYSISAAKLGSPAGGAAWLAATPAAEKMLPFFRRLRQEFYLTGRDEPFQAAMLAHSAEYMRSIMAEERERVSALNALARELLDGLQVSGKTVRATLPAAEASPWILHLNMPGVQSAVILRMLAQEDICVSSGSACQAETDKPDPAMKAWGFSGADAFSGLRISFGFSTTAEDIKFFAETLKKKLADY